MKRASLSTDARKSFIGRTRHLQVYCSLAIALGVCLETGVWRANTAHQQPKGLEIIFSDGFEDGDLLNWSKVIPAPKAIISATPTVGSPPLAVSFDGTGSSSSNGPIVFYSWNFGDGQSMADAVVEHSYSMPGNYEAQLTVADTLGGIGKESLTISVVNQSPEASFTVESTAGPGLEFNRGVPLVFNASQSSDSDGNIVQYLWSFGDGGIDSGPLVEHTFDVSGLYDVFLEVVDNFGSEATSGQLVEVVDPNQPPNAAFTASEESGVAPLQVIFDASLSTDPDDAQGKPIAWSWDFGDGVSATGETVSHIFEDAGTFQVLLTVTDADGLSDEASRTISINGLTSGPDLTLWNSVQPEITVGQLSGGDLTVWNRVILGEQTGAMIGPDLTIRNLFDPATFSGEVAGPDLTIQNIVGSLQNESYLDLQVSNECRSGYW